MTVSNFLSASRIPLGLAFVATSDTAVMAWLVVVAGATDVLDGFVARASGTRSQAGLLLDPLCDKVFVLLALSSFLFAGTLNLATFIILVLRDLFTGGAYIVARFASIVIPFEPRWPGKIATALQFLALLALIFAPEYLTALALIVGGASVWAIIDYGAHGLRRKWKRAV